jgi:uncharacterized hydrophobic protein (TIGR00341 family)
MYRLLEIVLPEESGEALRSQLEDADLIANWQESMAGDRLRVHLLVETPKTQSLLDALEQRFGHLEQFRVLTLRVHATIPRPPEPEETDEAKPSPEQVARDELYNDLLSGTKVTSVFVATVILSAIVAAVGLLRDNVAIIIGAMVIAPLLTPNMAMALATTLGDLSLLRKALKTQTVGVAIALAFAVLVGLFAMPDEVNEEIFSRTNATIGDVVLALASGAAGALAFTAGVSASLVGVMVAVALLPPLVVAGLFLGSGNPGLASGAILLLATNVICVNLAAVVTFLVRGVRPRTWWEADKARKSTRIAAALWIGALAVLIALMFLRQT